MVNRLVSVDESNNLPAEVQAQLVGNVETYFETLTDQAEAAATSAVSSATSAATDAEEADASRIAAEVAAGQAQAPTDLMVRDLIINPPTQTRTALDTTYAALNTVGMTVPVTVTAAEFNTALTTAASLGIPLVLPPNAVLSFSSQIQIPSKTRLNGNGSTLRNTVISGAAFVVVNNANDVIIENITIDGNKANYAGATEWKHGISISNSTRVLIRDTYSKENKGDGIYIGDQTLGPSFDIVMENVICDANYRQGLSISHASRVKAHNCKFINTAGTAPEAGVDIEPNVGGVLCSDIKFTDCEFSGNAGYGFLVVRVDGATTAQRGWHLSNCTSYENALGGVRIVNSEAFSWVGGSIRDNNGPGVTMNSTVLATDTEFTNVSISRNATHGVVVSGKFNVLTFLNCDIRDNGRVSTGDGLLIGPTVASTVLKVTACTSGGTSQRYGINVNSNVTDVALIGNSYPNNATNRRLLPTAAGFISTMVDMDVLPRPSVRAAATDAASTMTLANDLRTAMINRGFVS